MKKRPYSKMRAFRLTQTLEDALKDLADKTNRHQSCLIREAIWHFCTEYREQPHKLLKTI